MRGVASVVTALILWVLVAEAQQVGMLTQNAMLRSGPSSASGKLALLDAGEVVTLLREGHRAGYLRVRTQTEDVGWVWERYVRLIDPSEVHQPSSVHALQPAPTHALVARGDFDGCPDSGNAKPAGVRALNRLKNRSAEPGDADLDSAVTLAAILAPSSDDAGRFSDTKAAELTAYVFRVIPGGRSETSNCKMGDPVHRDTHIEFTVSPSDTDEIRRVIVEVTPRWRAALQSEGVDWSTATLQQTLEGRWVKVRGWLMFDEEHKAQAENTHPGGDTNWRATAWEVHPITSMAVVQQP